MSTKMVVVKAVWCGPCKNYAPVVEDAKPALLAKGCEVEFLDADENKDFLEKHSVRAVPYTLIFKNGVVVNSFAGARTKEQLLKEIE